MATKTGVPSIDRDQETIEKLQKRSDKATGIVGKFFTLPAADSCAYYTVEAEKGKKVLVRHHALIDGWTDTILGKGGWFPTSQIAPIIRAEEGMAAVFKKAKREQDDERTLLEKSVVAAIAKDLGMDADVYDLAHWCWERDGVRGKADARLHKMGGRVPWKSDLSHVIEKSKMFQAVTALKSEYAFSNLVDSYVDPRVYRKAPPPVIVVLAAVSIAMEEAIGAVPQGLQVVMRESKYLTSTFVDVVNKAGIKVASVYYNPETLNIENVEVHFTKKKDKIEGMEKGI